MKFRFAHLAWPLLCALPASGWAAPIDEFRISVIEQQLRDLQNTVNEQARLITDLRQADQQRSGTRAPAVSSSTPAINATIEQRWLSVSNWQKLKPGMNELAVIELLGPPNQLRSEDAKTRELLYALEIGRSGFLTGKVTMTDGAVSKIDLPTLR